MGCTGLVTYVAFQSEFSEYPLCYGGKAKNGFTW